MTRETMSMNNRRPAGSRDGQGHNSSTLNDAVRVAAIPKGASSIIHLNDIERPSDSPYVSATAIPSPVEIDLRVDAHS